MAYLSNTQNSLRRMTQRINAWKGLNRSDGAGDGSFAAVSNLATDDYPSARTRGGRSVVPGFEDMNVTEVFNADGHTVVVADGMLYYDGTEMINVGDEKKQFAQVNTRLVIWPDKLQIDLNTGDITRLDAEVSGIAYIDPDGKTLSVTVSGAVEIGTLSITHEYGVPDRGVWHCYEGLTWTEGIGFSWTSRSTGIAHVGAQFIAIESGGHWMPRKARNLIDYDDPTGSHYGVVTDVKQWSYAYGIYTVTEISYKIYDAAGGETTLTEQFTAGDPVSTDGFAILYNNKENLILDDVNNLNLTFPEGSLVPYGYYLTLDAALNPGTYKVRFQISEEEGNEWYDLGKITTKRVIRAGEQIYRTGGAIVENEAEDPTCDYYIDRTGGEWYVYDPVTKAREPLIWTWDGDALPTPLEMEMTLPGAANEGITIRREVPDMQYVCEHDNRLWGVSNEETDEVYNERTGERETVRSRVIFASALGEPSRFYEYKGLATDSYAVAVAGVGDFTALCKYQGALLAWKEDRMYRLTGSFPAEYYLRSYNIDGVASGSAHSIQVINQALYYLAPAGVMSYYGTAPTYIGEQLGMNRLREGVAGRDRTHYYLSAAESDGRHLYAYDVAHGLWTEETPGGAVSMDRFGDRCHAVIDGEICVLDAADSAETVSWSAELFRWDEGTFAHKRYLHVTVEADVPEGATLALKWKDERDLTWQTAQLQREPEIAERVYRWVLDTKRAARMHVRLQGTGAVKVYALEREFEIESER